MIPKEAEALKGERVRFVEQNGRETEMTVRQVSLLLNPMPTDEATFIAYADMKHYPQKAIHLYVRPETKIEVL